METASWFETSVTVYQSTRRHTEDPTPHQHRCDNLKSHTPQLSLAALRKWNGTISTDMLLSCAHLPCSV